jgi:hypothetical protein
MNHTPFSPDFSTARQRFREGLSAARGDFRHIPLGCTDQQAERLGIDIAWFGNQRPRRALIHVCGIHGVEGFAGAAVQLALLDKLPVLPEDVALILVHVLNPYGMAYLRRGNENNVDLNRNFFLGSGGWSGVAAGYAALNDFLNPPRPPSRINFFHLRLLLAELSLGTGAIRQAVAGGQYYFPKGIFYGGSSLEEGPKRYGEWLATHLSGVHELLVIDVHTGLGAYGRQSLFLRSDTDTLGLTKSLGLPLTTNKLEATVMGYEHEGGQSSIYRQLLPEAKALSITQEFGTYNGRRLLRALRAENQYHHYGDGRLDHWSKTKLKALFCPEDERWRSRVVTQGCDFIQRSVQLLASGDVDRLATNP